MAKQGYTPTEIQIALQERIAQLDAVAQELGWGRVVAEPYPNQVAGGWQVYQGQPILPHGYRPAIASNETTGNVVVGTTQGIRPLPNGEYGLYNFKPPKAP